MADRKLGQQTPVTRTTIAGIDWENRILSQETHEQVAFVDVDLSEATIDGSTFSDCTFRGAKFNCSRSINAAFINCTFSNCNFFEAKFTDCKMVGSAFTRCTFDIMAVDGGNWSHVALPGADLRKATFNNVRLREADLAGAKCHEGVMRDCDMSGASLGGVDFRDCDLRGSDISALEPDAAKLYGAIISVEQAVAIATQMGLDVRVE